MHCRCEAGAHNTVSTLYAQSDTDTVVLLHVTRNGMLNVSMRGGGWTAGAGGPLLAFIRRQDQPNREHVVLGTDIGGAPVFSSLLVPVSAGDKVLLTPSGTRDADATVSAEVYIYGSRDA